MLSWTGIVLFFVPSWSTDPLFVHSLCILISLLSLSRCPDISHCKACLPFVSCFMQFIVKMGQSTLLKLTALCIIYASVPSATAFSAASHALQVLNLLERAEPTCPTNATACGQGLPSNFCCPSTTTCQPFNGGKSAICCPAGVSCSYISAISCDLSLQNASSTQSSELYTTELTGTLASCGPNTCCPNGYTCQDNKGCQLNSPSATSSSPPSATSASPNSPPSNSPTSSNSANQPTSSSTSQTSAPGSTQLPGPTANYNKYPTSAVMVGFFPGLVAGVILAVIALCCFGRRHSKEESEPTSPDFSSVTATVSDPIYQPEGNNAFRSDFLRRESKSKYSRRTSNASRVRSLFARTPTLKSMRSRDAAVDGLGRSIPKVPETPINQRSPEPSLKKEPSMESIKIYSPPNGGLHRPETTFAEMLREAGFKNDEPYLGSPGRVGLGLDSILHESNNIHR